MFHILYGARCQPLIGKEAEKICIEISSAHFLFHKQTSFSQRRGKAQNKQSNWNCYWEDNKLSLNKEDKIARSEYSYNPDYLMPSGYSFEGSNRFFEYKDKRSVLQKGDYVPNFYTSTKSRWKQNLFDKKAINKFISYEVKKQ